ncbi:MAG: SoxR reducing system RseC family protein [gamma proteobacterium endosymbiont of Lamellibrachia anaximandri]|nr:SoxR reducing system RseC family protein [gamma proteobacterium endosymbiont of Lamellibrachia anaximandri]MBL3618066.1 SoxR reducing system RseC family protein [gamma proteobacterium endosymbiont of Lamellibrachia anaximandri]
MIEENATVVSCEGDHAVVETRQKAACGSCHSADSCGTSVISGLFKRKHNQLRVLNAVGAKPGERVVIGLQERALVNASLVAYLLPLFFMISFAFAGQELMGLYFQPAGELIAILCGLLGLILGLFLTQWYARRKKRDSAFQAAILRQESNSPVHF